LSICSHTARVYKLSMVRPCLWWLLSCSCLLAFIFLFFVMVSLASFVRSFPCVAFSGSRLSGSSAAASCRAFLPLLSGLPASVGVGCACGVDSLVRLAFPSALVFRVSSFAVGGRVSRASFARRSAALVRWLASGGGLLVAFPGCLSCWRCRFFFVSWLWFWFVGFCCSCSWFGLFGACGVACGCWCCLVWCFGFSFPLCWCCSLRWLAVVGCLVCFVQLFISCSVVCLFACLLVCSMF